MAIPVLPMCFCRRTAMGNAQALWVRRQGATSASLLKFGLGVTQIFQNTCMQQCPLLALQLLERTPTQKNYQHVRRAGCFTQAGFDLCSRTDSG